VMNMMPINGISGNKTKQEEIPAFCYYWYMSAETDSRRVYDYLLQEFRSRFEWLRLSDQDIDPVYDGLATVLMDSCINTQFVEEYKKNPGAAEEWKVFFGFIEEMLQSEDSTLTETIETTILEMLASEAYVDLESVLPYCGSKTREAIYNSIRVFYGKPERADCLARKYDQ